MQSEFTCHIGLRGKLFCRACWVKGPDAQDEGGIVRDPENEQGADTARNSSNSDDGSEAESMAGSEASAGSENSEGGAAPVAGKKGLRKKAVETMSQLLRRAGDFIKVLILVECATARHGCSHLFILDSDLDRQASSQIRDRREAE